ncbi:MAG: hypothetical protein ABH834_08445 [Candidatus Altiarchaeota archaeon]
MAKVAMRQAPGALKKLPLESFSLADDVSGRITHVLIQSDSKPRIPFIESAVEQMGGHVHFSIAFPHGRYSKLSDDDREALKKVADDNLGRVSLVRVHTDPSNYAQDAFISLVSDEGPAVMLGEDALIADRGGSFNRRAGDAKIVKTLLGGGGFVAVDTNQDALGLAWFQMGDAVSDDKTIFLGPDTLNQNLYAKMLAHQKALLKGIEPPHGYWLLDEPKRGVRFLTNLNLNNDLGFDEAWVYRRRSITKPMTDNPSFSQAYEEVLASASRPLHSFESHHEKEQKDFLSHLKAFWDINRFLHAGADSETVASVRSDVLDKVGVVAGGRRLALMERFDRMVHHVDTHITPLGDNVVLVGDTNWGLSLLSASERKRFEKWTLSFNGDAAGELDDKAAFIAGLGYAVDRIPLVAKDVRTDFTSPMLSYNNVNLEVYGDGGGTVRTVYLPEYGFPDLDAAARQVYERHDFGVVAIQGLAGVIRSGSSERCNMKVLRRDRRL